MGSVIPAISSEVRSRSVGSSESAEAVPAILCQEAMSLNEISLPRIVEANSSTRSLLEKDGVSSTKQYLSRSLGY